MKINTKQTIKTLQGEVIKGSDNKDFTIGTPLSEILLAAEEGGKAKMYSLALKFVNEEEVDLDGGDLILVKNSVERTKLYNNLVTGQLLIMLNGEEKKKN